MDAIRLRAAFAEGQLRAFIRLFKNREGRIGENGCANNVQRTRRTKGLGVIFTGRGGIDPVAFGAVKWHLLTVEREKVLTEELAQPREQITKSTNHRKIAPNGILRLVRINEKHDHDQQNAEADGQHKERRKDAEALNGNARKKFHSLSPYLEIGQPDHCTRCNHNNPQKQPRYNG